MQQRPNSLRLSYHRFQASDAAFFQHLANTPDYHAFIGDRGISSPAAAVTFFETKIYPGDKAPWLGTYVIRLQSTHEAIGTIGIYTRPGLEVPDLGFAILPKHYRRGYAAEAARALMDFAVAASQPSPNPIRQLSAIVLPHNKASRSLLDKLGFADVRAITLPTDNARLRYYEWTTPTKKSA